MHWKAFSLWLYYKTCSENVIIPGEPEEFLYNTPDNMN